MKIVVLTEAGKQYGLGHLTRCTSIINAFQELGHNPKLVIHGDDSYQHLINYPFELRDWKKPHLLIQEVNNADIVIVDSYLADEKTYNDISNHAKLSVYLDDNNRLDYPKGIIVNGGIHAQSLNYPEKENTNHLLGINFQAVRKAFWKNNKRLIPTENIKSIFITMGGSDPLNLSPSILSIISKYFQNIKLNILITKAYSSYTDLMECTSNNISVYYEIDDIQIKKLMQESDVAISASGQTLFELAITKTPTINIITAENQLQYAEFWNKTELFTKITYKSPADFENDLVSKVKNLDSHKLRLSMIESLPDTISPNGSNNIVKEILSKYYA